MNKDSVHKIKNYSKELQNVLNKQRMLFIKSEDDLVFSENFIVIVIFITFC